MSGEYETLTSRLSDMQRNLDELNREVRCDIDQLGAIRRGLQGLRIDMSLLGLLGLLVVLLLIAAVAHDRSFGPSRDGETEPPLGGVGMEGGQ